ncbi:MAG: AEC family transporter [Vitreoscilla sp.]|nr:AEC family transporter [Vitreoscilla sp.]
MQHILAVTTPFFALVLLGWVVVRLRVLPLDTIPGFNGFVLFFALPCMLFRFSAATPIAQLLDGTVVTVYLASAAVMVALAVFVARRRALRWNDAAFAALVGAFPNSGFMGVPLLVALLGQAAAAPAIVALALDMVVTTSLCIALSQLGHADGDARSAVARALRGMLGNPLPWSIALGTLSSATGVQLPGPASHAVEMMATAASPVALFALGAMLARGQMTASAVPRSREAGAVVAIVAHKLIVHPLVLFGAGAIAIAAGMPLDPFAAVVLVLVAALPSASNVPILAERFQADAGRLARAVLVSTIGAFASFSALVAWFDAPARAPQHVVPPAR